LSHPLLQGLGKASLRSLYSNPNKVTVEVVDRNLNRIQPLVNEYESLDQFVKECRSVLEIDLADQADWQKEIQTAERRMVEIKKAIRDILKNE
jgi:NADP-dependent 3-hydroxy acid dehydrogenase YdfG